MHDLLLVLCRHVLSRNPFFDSSLEYLRFYFTLLWMSYDYDRGMLSLDRWGATLNWYKKTMEHDGQCEALPCRIPLQISANVQCSIERIQCIYVIVHVHTTVYLLKTDLCNNQMKSHKNPVINHFCLPAALGTSLRVMRLMTPNHMIGSAPCSLQSRQTVRSLQRLQGSLKG